MKPGVEQPASMAPDPDRPATWKMTSAFWPIICWAIDLPVPGSLNALVMSVETYWTRTLTFGLTDAAPFRYPLMYRTTAGIVLIPPTVPITPDFETLAATTPAR